MYTPNPNIPTYKRKKEKEKQKRGEEEVLSEHALAHPLPFLSLPLSFHHHHHHAHLAPPIPSFPALNHLSRIPYLPLLYSTLLYPITKPSSTEPGNYVYRRPFCPLPPRAVEAVIAVTGVMNFKDHWDRKRVCVGLPGIFFFFKKKREGREVTNREGWVGLGWAGYSEDHSYKIRCGF